MVTDTMTIGYLMKEHEKRTDFTITPFQPIILRLDGNSFHIFTRGWFDVPFDDSFKDAMYQAAIAVIDYCQGRIAYVQSDEISVLINHAQGNNFLNNRIQKICSLAASMCAVRFSTVISQVLQKPTEAHFDCRCISIPIEDVQKYFYWRQQDAIKNAINSIYYWKLRESMGVNIATKQSEGITTHQKENWLRDQGILIDTYPVHYIRGALIYKETTNQPIENVAPADIIEKFGKQGQIVTRYYWLIEKTIPVFTFDDKWLENKIKANDVPSLDKNV